MKSVIEIRSGDTALTVEISAPFYGQDNLVITQTKKPDYAPVVVSTISFELDAGAARSLSFAFGELAKIRGVVGNSWEVSCLLHRLALESWREGYTQGQQHGREGGK